MILYHVSLVENYNNILFDNIGSTLFIPRIPEHMADFENKTIKRICLSTSIEKCLIAANNLSMLRDNVIILVYTVEIDDEDENLLKPNEVYNTGNVKDALENEEYWYIKPLYLDGEYYKIIEIDYEPCLGWKNISIEEFKYFLRNVFNYVECDEIYKELNEVMNSIANKDYSTAEEYYNEACKYLSDNNLYEYEDELYDKLVNELYWIQSYKINKFKCKQIQIE